MHYFVHSRFSGKETPLKMHAFCSDKVHKKIAKTAHSPRSEKFLTQVKYPPEIDTIAVTQTE